MKVLSTPSKMDMFMMSTSSSPPLPPATYPPTRLTPTPPPRPHAPNPPTPTPTTTTTTTTTSTTSTSTSTTTPTTTTTTTTYYYYYYDDCGYDYDSDDDNDDHDSDYDRSLPPLLPLPQLVYTTSHIVCICSSPLRTSAPSSPLSSAPNSRHEHMLYPHGCHDQPQSGIS